MRRLQYAAVCECIKVESFLFTVEQSGSARLRVIRQILSADSRERERGREQGQGIYFVCKIKCFKSQLKCVALAEAEAAQHKERKKC